MLVNFNVGTVHKKRINLFDFSDGVNGLIDEHLGKNTLAKTSYNFDYSDGALKSGIGIKPFEVVITDCHFVADFPKDNVPQKIFYYKRFDDTLLKRDDRILLLYANGDVYEWKMYSGLSTTRKIEGLNFLKSPYYVNYRLNSEDTIMFSTDEYLYVYNGEVVKVFDAPEITSMCIHNERLFATTKNSETELWFSKTFDPTNWNVSLDEAGFIDLRTKAGRLLKVISLDGYLYAIANYGIYRITAYNEQLEMTAESLYLNSGRIIRGSITECGKNVIYLAEDGFYKFNGTSAYRIMTELDKFVVGVDNEDVSAIYYNGKFYAAVNMRIDGKITKVLVVYDLYRKDFYLGKGLDVYDLEKIEGDEFSLLAILSEGYFEIGLISSDGAKFGRPLMKIWKSKDSDFGIDGEKTFAYINLYSRSDIYLKVKSDVSERTINIKGSKLRQRVKVGVKGRTFSLTFKSKSKNAEISKVALEIQYL